MLKQSDLDKLIKHNHNNNDINSAICWFCSKDTNRILYTRYKLEWIYALCENCYVKKTHLKKLTTKEIFYLKIIQPNNF